MSKISLRIKPLQISGLAAVICGGALAVSASAWQAVATSHQISASQAIVAGAAVSEQVTATHTGHYWPELLLNDTPDGRTSNRFLKLIDGDVDTIAAKDALDNAAYGIAARAISWSVYSGGKKIQVSGPAHYFYDGHGVVLVAGAFPVESGVSYTVEAISEPAFGEIAALDPRLQVQADPAEVMGIIFETVFLMATGIIVAFVGLILLVVAYTLQWRSRHSPILAHEQ